MFADVPSNWLSLANRSVEGRLRSESVCLLADLMEYTASHLILPVGL